MPKEIVTESNRDELKGRAQKRSGKAKSRPGEIEICMVPECNMSQKDVEQILGKMLLDVEFRKQLTSNPNQVLAGYELTDDEREGFKNMDLDDFHQTLTSLDERVSKAWNN